MSDPRMPDDLATRLARAFRGADLPAAPASLRDALERVVDAPVVARDRGSAERGRVRNWSVLGLAAVLVIGGAVAVAIGQQGPSVVVPGPSDGLAPSISPAPAAVRITYEVQWSDTAPEDPEDLQTIVDVLLKRLDAAGILGAVVESSPPGQVTVDLPAGADRGPLARLLGQTGSIAFVPLGSTPAEPGDVVDLLRFDPLFGSEGILDAAVDAGSDGQPAVTINLDSAASQTFGDWTASHIGNYLAITSDGIVLTAPVINTEIRGGSVEISQGGPGGYDAAEAAQLVAILGSGPLPVPITEIGSGPRPSEARPTPSREPIAERRCEPPIATTNRQLSCEEAVSAALAILPAGHPPIAMISFRHQCFDPDDPNAALDCAVEAFGIVDLIDDAGRPLTAVGVRLDGTGTPLAVLLPRRAAAGADTFELAPANGDVGCDSILPPYRSFVIHIDPIASPSVWAIADTGARLHVVWGTAFQGLVGPPARVVDDYGLEVARDGTVVAIPDGAWPALAGRFVCPSTDTVYVFDQAAPA